jgi:hypothetical protein
LFLEAGVPFEVLDNTDNRNIELAYHVLHLKNMPKGGK